MAEAKTAVEAGKLEEQEVKMNFETLAKEIKLVVPENFDVPEMVAFKKDISGSNTNSFYGVKIFGAYDEVLN